ncbi:Uncharacterised protein [uncultured archaeon]|nr:Uncharacterised protein [uncultured archaeon]
MKMPMKFIGRYIRAIRKRLVTKPMMMRRFLSLRSFSSASFSLSATASSPATPRN